MRQTLHALALVFATGAFLSAAELPCGSAESVEGLMDRWVAAYDAMRPAVPAAVTRRAKFSADLVEALARGELSVAPFARELFPQEEKRFVEIAGVVPRMVPIATGSRATKGATHAIALFVHERNPLRGLTIAQVRGIFSGEIRTWGQLGLGGAWIDRPIRLHGMRVRRPDGNPPGIVNFLERRVMDGRAWSADRREHVDSTDGPQALDLIIRAVADDECAIGYSGFGYAIAGVRSVPLAENATGPFLSGTADEIAARKYPLTRTLYLAIAPARAAEADTFLRHVLGESGQAEIGRDPHGFFALPAPVAAAAALPGGYRPRHVTAPSVARYVTADGAIVIVGYNDMAEMLAALSARFGALHPGIRFVLRLPGTRAAPAALAKGESAFAPMGADFSPRQLADYRRANNGESPRRFRIAHASLDPAALSGPLAVVVHPANPLRKVSLPELRAIFTGEDRRGLHPTGLAADTALGEFMRTRVLDGAEFTTGWSSFAQSRDVVRAVASDPHAIGFAAAVSVNERVRILPVAPTRDMPPVALTAENIHAGRYPLDRFLLIYTRAEMDPVTREFLRFVLSREGQEIIAQGHLGYLPLNEQEIAQELAALGERQIVIPESELR